MIIGIIVTLCMIFWAMKILAWILGGATSLIEISNSAALMRNFSSLGNLRNRSYADISNKVGRCNQEYSIHLADGSPAYRRIWDRSRYSISIIFDGNNMFHHIEKETTS